MNAKHTHTADNATPMAQLIELSHYYGANPEFVLAGGGNTSVKDDTRLWVKGSGTALAEIDETGFVEMDRAKIDALLASTLSDDTDEREEQFKTAIMAARVQPELGQRPSVECVLHNLLPARFIVHTHATKVNMLTCTQGGEAKVRELFGDEVLWAPYVDPGFVLASRLNDLLAKWVEKTGRKFPPALMMENHGLIVCGDTPAEVRENTENVMDRITALLDMNSNAEPFGAITRLDADIARAQIDRIGPALRGLLAEDGAAALKVATFSDDDDVMALVGGAEGAKMAAGGPLCPDAIVYCKSMALWFEPREGEEMTDLVARLGEAVAAHTKATGFAPKVVLVKGVGLFGVGDDFKAADTVRQVFTDAIRVMAGAARLGGIQFMTQRDREFIEHWEVENYRRKVAAAGRAAGRADGKIAFVTGAAQGFGLGIAQNLVGQGAHVVLADLNVEGAQAAAAAICDERGPGRALGLAVNITERATIVDALHQVVRTYGGIDLFVANAAVLKAESVKTQSEKDFDFVTTVNYKGYFLSVQCAAPILAVQHAARPDYWSDIVQISSKSGLQGSNKNGAYAGSKFGGIGLTQSFAMELVVDGVKVNSICPGNFFDGPLWSDPERGLFVQYLRTNKVPGAQTIEDVKRFYEAKVPIGRGCTPTDVMHAMYYLMDQHYETGQAVPVTGGQVMLK